MEQGKKKMEGVTKKRISAFSSRLRFFVTPRTVRYPKNDNVNMKCHINNNN